MYISNYIYIYIYLQLLIYIKKFNTSMTPKKVLFLLIHAKLQQYYKS